MGWVGCCVLYDRCISNWTSLVDGSESGWDVKVRKAGQAIYWGTWLLKENCQRRRSTSILLRQRCKLLAVFSIVCTQIDFQAKGLCANSTWKWYDGQKSWWRRTTLQRGSRCSKTNYWGWRRVRYVPWLCYLMCGFCCLHRIWLIRQTALLFFLLK